MFNILKIPSFFIFAKNNIKKKLSEMENIFEEEKISCKSPKKTNTLSIGIIAFITSLSIIQTVKTLIHIIKTINSKSFNSQPKNSKSVDSPSKNSKSFNSQDHRNPVVSLNKNSKLDSSHDSSKLVDSQDHRNPVDSSNKNSESDSSTDNSKLVDSQDQINPVDSSNKNSKLDSLKQNSKSDSSKDNSKSFNSQPKNSESVDSQHQINPVVSSNKNSESVDSPSKINLVNKNSKLVDSQHQINPVDSSNKNSKLDYSHDSNSSDSNSSENNSKLSIKLTKTISLSSDSVSQSNEYKDHSSYTDSQSENNDTVEYIIQEISTIYNQYDDDTEKKIEDIQKIIENIKKILEGLDSNTLQDVIVYICNDTAFSDSSKTLFTQFINMLNEHFDSILTPLINKHTMQITKFKKITIANVATVTNLLEKNINYVTIILKKNTYINQLLPLLKDILPLKPEIKLIKQLLKYIITHYQINNQSKDTTINIPLFLCEILSIYDKSELYDNIIERMLKIICTSRNIQYFILQKNDSNKLIKYLLEHYKSSIEELDYSKVLYMVQFYILTSKKIEHENNIKLLLNLFDTDDLNLTKDKDGLKRTYGKYARILLCDKNKQLSHNTIANVVNVLQLLPNKLVSNYIFRESIIDNIKHITDLVNFYTQNDPEPEVMKEIDLICKFYKFIYKILVKPNPETDLYTDNVYEFLKIIYKFIIHQDYELQQKTTSDHVTFIMNSINKIYKFSI